MKRPVLLFLFIAVGVMGCPPEDDDRDRNNIIIDKQRDTSTTPADAGDAGTGGDGGGLDGGADMGGPDSCIPETDEEMCERFEFECGPLMGEDNCGEEREIDSCGDPAEVCEAPDVCGGGGSPGQCGCARATCEELGVLCGEVEDTCGGTLDCDLFCVDAISAGGDHACAIGSGNIKCWGAGGEGQLGNAASSDEKNPVDVDWGMAAVQVLSASAGGGHTCIVDAAGRVVCWGENERSQLGIGTTVDSDLPGAPAIMSGGELVRSGESHACALSDAGQVSCWGSNDYGQIGDSSLNLLVNIGVPTVPDGLDSNVVALATGWNHTCVLQDDPDTGASRVLKCWGRNHLAQTQALPTNAILPVENSPNDMTGYAYDKDLGWDLDSLVNAPVEVPDPENGGQWTDIKAVATGGKHTCVIDSTDRLWCWGHMPGFDPDTSCPKVDDKTADTCSVFPRDQGIFVTQGTFEAGALTDTSTIEAVWVANEPIQVSTGDKTPVTLSAGRDHHCILIDNPDPDSSNIMCFGRNHFGQVGDGTSNNWSEPRQVFLDVNDNPVIATQISLGNSHTCALVNDSNVKCWGSNASGQIGNSSLQRDESYRPYDVKLEADVE